MLPAVSGGRREGCQRGLGEEECSWTKEGGESENGRVPKSIRRDGRTGEGNVEVGIEQLDGRLWCVLSL